MGDIKLMSTMAKFTLYCLRKRTLYGASHFTAGANLSLCGLRLCSVKEKSAPKNSLGIAHLRENADGFYLRLKSRKLLLEVFWKTLASAGKMFVPEEEKRKREFWI